MFVALYWIENCHLPVKLLHPGGCGRCNLVSVLTLCHQSSRSAAGEPQPAHRFRSSRHAPDPSPHRTPARWVPCDLKVSGFCGVRWGNDFELCTFWVSHDDDPACGEGHHLGSIVITVHQKGTKSTVKNVMIGADICKVANDVCFCSRDCLSSRIQQHHTIDPFWLPGFGWRLFVWSMQKSRGILQQRLWR